MARIGRVHALFLALQTTYQLTYLYWRFSKNSADNMLPMQVTVMKSVDNLKFLYLARTDV